MLDLKLIRETPETFDAGWKRRGMTAQTPAILKLDEAHRADLTAMEVTKAKMNELAKEIGHRKAKKENADDLMAQAAEIKAKVAGLETSAKEKGEQVKDALARLPNIPDASVPDGTSEKDNKEVRKFGTPKTIENAKEHFDLGEKLGGMDFETAAKMSGSRFVLLKGGLARLERALAQFMLDTHTQEHGYTEMSAPLLVNKNALFGTGQLPKFEEDLFKIQHFDYDMFAGLVRKFIEAKLMKDDRYTNDPSYRTAIDKIHVTPSKRSEIEFILSLDEMGPEIKSAAKEAVSGMKYLIPTSEVSLTNTVLDSILNFEDLPLRLTALTPCFRSEAGSAGKDTRGMIRQHQFYKVELVSITAADKSNEEHERMLNCAETILKKLDLPFRTVALCTGDMGFSARKTFDIEVWLPGQNTYREISSCSNCGDFQARRMMARYKKEGDKNTTYVHTLNGSGVAVGRALVAVLENYQQPDGSIIIPDVLKPYMGGITKLEVAA